MPPLAVLGFDPHTLGWIDAGVQAAGLAIALALGLRALRRGDRRLPLADVPHHGTGPGLAHLAVLSISYVVLVGSAASAIPAPGGAEKPGDATWHARTALVGGISLALTLFVGFALRRFPIFLNREAALPWPRLIPIAIVACVAIMPICLAQAEFASAVWAWLSPNVRPPTHDVLDALRNSAWGTSGVVHLFLMALLVAPLSEEFFFRGLLLDTLWRYTGLAWLSIAMSAAAFAYVHLAQPQAVLPMFTFGVLLGYLRLRFRSIGLCVMVHMLFNSRAMLLATLDSVSKS